MLLIDIAHTYCYTIRALFNSYNQLRQIINSNNGTTKLQRLQYSKVNVSFDLLKNFNKPTHHKQSGIGVVKS